MRILLKKIIKITLVITLIIHLLNVIFFYKGPFLETLINFKSIGIGALYSFLITIACTFYFGVLDRNTEWGTQSVSNMVFRILGSTLVVLPTFFLCRAIHLTIIMDKYGFKEFVAQEKIGAYGFPFVLTIAINLFFHAVGFYKALQEKKINEQKIIAGTATAKFVALKNQLDPHFLFNSLNVLTSLIEENPIAAQKFTTSLSKVYRYVLEQKDKDVVGVDEELKFAQIYMSLLQMRFENSIFLELPDTLQNSEAKIVPLSLQLLLENTVKHNVIMVEKPLYIKIYEKDGFLYVTNNLQPKAIMKTESGVGLANISQRYEMLTKRKFSTEKTKKEFIAKLPILTKKIITVVKPIETTFKEDIRYKLAKEPAEHWE